MEQVKATTATVFETILGPLLPLLREQCAQLKDDANTYNLRFAPMAKSFLNYYLDFFDSVLVYSIILTQPSTTHHKVSYRS